MGSRACLVDTLRPAWGQSHQDTAHSPGSLVNTCPDPNFLFQQDQSQRPIPVPPALWPSPLRNSSASMWAAVTPLRSFQGHQQGSTFSQRNPAQRIRVSSSKGLIHTAGMTTLKVKRSKKGPNLCVKGSGRGGFQGPFRNHSMGKWGAVRSVRKWRRESPGQARKCIRSTQANYLWE